MDFGPLPGANAKLPRRLKLLTPDFAAVLRSGKLFRGRGLSILLRNNHIAWPRLGMVVPKRIVRRAVDRNRLKRVFREWFRHNQELLAGKDCVVRLSALKKADARLCDDRVLVVELERLISAKGM